MEQNGSQWSSRLLRSSNYGITTFGEDEDGEVYVADAKGGIIYRIQGSRAPRFSAAAVTNSASFESGMVAGSLVTAFAAGVRDTPASLVADRVPLPESLGGVSVTVGGIAAGIYSISNVNGQEQVSFLVPGGVAGQSSAPVIITRDGQANAAVGVPVLAVQPGVYTNNGQAIVVRNSDYTLHAPRGDYVFLYASGLGTFTSAIVTLAGLPCDVQYAGAAPGFPGVYQVNFRIPTNVPTGAQDLVLAAGSVSSPTLRVAVE